MKYTFGLPIVLLAFAASIGVSAPVYAQTPATQDHDHQAAADAKPATPADQRQGMMMMNMMTDMQAADAKLNALVQTMNAAKGAEKTDAIAAVVTALVQEHGAMRGRMMNMMGMMGNMPGMSGMTGAMPEKAKP